MFIIDSCNQSCKNPTNLQTWFGGRFWPTNEESFVDRAPIPFSWESGNQLRVECSSGGEPRSLEPLKPRSP